MRLANCLALTLALNRSALAADISGLVWDRANIATLRSFGKADVAQLLTAITGFALPVKPADIGEFTWADLQGDGKVELVATMDVNGRAFFNALFILWKDSSGKVRAQELDGWMIRDLHKVIRDLNGDGKDELIIPTVLVQYSTAGTFTWPVVYRLENRKYVEASRDFPGFYDDQVLPSLEKQIGDYQSKQEPGNQEMAAALIFERDKILRMLGRNPTAGLQQAYHWMNTDDPYLLQNAAATFKEIGGHQAELRAAAEARDRALCERTPGMAMCKDAAPR